MIKGLLANWDLDFTMAWNFSETTSNVGAICSGGISCSHASTYTVVVNDLSITLVANSAPPPVGAPDTVLTVTVLGSQHQYVLGSSFITSGTVDVLIGNYAVYYNSSTGKFDCSWSSITVSYNGGVLQTLGSGSVSSSFIAPCGVPFMGYGARLSASASFNQAPVLGVPDKNQPSGGRSGNSSASVTGGYRFREYGSGTWQALPVNIMTASSSVCSSIAPNPSPPYPSGSNTYNCTCTANGILSGSTTQGVSAYITYVTSNCDLWIIPDLPKSVVRLNPNYAAMIYRFAMPQSTIISSSANFDYVTNSNTCNQSSYVHPHPTMSQFLGVPGNSIHPIENPFALPSYCPYDTMGNSFYGYNDNTGEDAQSLTVASSFVGIMDVDWTGDYFPPLTIEPPPSNDVYGPLGKYLNVWCAPHWSFMFYFPPDSETDSNAWVLDGNSKAPSQYWIPIRTQWLHNSALPPAEGDNTRTDLCLAPLANQPYLLWGDSSPWGISRFAAETLTSIPSFTFSSGQSSLFSITNGAGAYGGGNITITPTNTTVTVNIALQAFSVAPYMLLSIFKSVTLGWSGANVVSAVANLIGQDGSTMQILTAPGTFSWQNASIPSPTKYCGSWGQDFSYGQTSDAGSDYDSNGVSIVSMSDPIHIACDQFLTSYTAKTLQIVFTLANNSTAFTLNYPSFAPPDGTTPFQYVPETGMSGTHIAAGLSGARTGQWQFFTPSTSIMPPAEYALGGAESAVDAMATKYALFVGSDPIAGTTSQIASIFNSTEGSGTGNAALDTLGFSFVASGQSYPSFIYCNTLRELPPMYSLPYQTKSASLAPSGSYAQTTYDFSVKPRFLIYPKSVTDIFQPANTQWTSGSTYSISGWVVRQHVHPVTNSEDATFFCERNGAKYGILSPWHGYKWTGASPTPASNVQVLCHNTGRLNVMNIESGGAVRNSVSTRHQTPWDVSALTGLTGVDSVRVCAQNDQSIWMTVNYTSSGSKYVQVYYSDDDGQSFNSFGSPMSATQSDIKANEVGDLYWVIFTPNSGTTGPGTLSGYFKGGGDTTVTGPFPITNGTSQIQTDGTQFGLDAGCDQARAWYLAFIVNGESSPSVWMSDDNGLSYIRMNGT